MNTCSAEIRLKFIGENEPQPDWQELKEEYAESETVDGIQLMTLSGEDEAISIDSGDNSFILGREMIILDGLFEEDEVKDFMNVLDTVLGIFFKEVENSYEYKGHTRLSSRSDKPIEDIFSVFVESKDTLNKINSLEFSKDIKGHETGVEITREDKESKISIINGIDFIVNPSENDGKEDKEELEIIEILNDQIEKFKILNTEIEQEI